MPDKRRRKPSAPPSGQSPSRAKRPALSLRRVGQGSVWELVHPRCAQQRAEDLDEVRRMIEGGEHEIATEELRWLLEGCPECLDAHMLLGVLATARGDARLARGHFGFAYDLGLAAIPDRGWQGTIPYERAANQGFLTAARGLARCLRAMGDAARAREVIASLLAWDPSDPLEVGTWFRGDASDGREPKL